MQSKLSSFSSIPFPKSPRLPSATGSVLAYHPHPEISDFSTFSMHHCIGVLPAEVTFKIFNYLDDVDLYSLLKVPRLSELVNSKEYKSIRKAQRQHYLERALGSSRPTFPSLVERRYILGGSNTLRLWQEGVYLFTPTLIHHMTTTVQFHFQFIKSKISKHLRARPALLALQTRNILPMTPVSQRLVSRWLQLQKVQLVYRLRNKIRSKWRTGLDIHSIGAILDRFLANRVQPFELGSKKLVCEKDLATWICPGVRDRIHFFERAALSPRVYL